MRKKTDTNDKSTKNGSGDVNGMNVSLQIEPNGGTYDDYNIKKGEIK